MKFLLVNASFPTINQLSHSFQSFEHQGKGLINFDIIAEDFGKKLSLLNAKLEDLINIQIFNKKDSRKTNVQRVQNHFGLKDEMWRVDAAVYVGGLIVLVLADVLLQGKSQKELFLRRNTKKLLELMVFIF